MTLLYNRKVALTIQEVTFEGVGSKRKAVVNSNYIDGFNPMAPLRVAWDIEKTIKPEPNRGRITVWNLNNANRAAPQKDYHLIFRAGYAPDDADILQLPIRCTGGITNIKTIKESVDWKTVFQIGDGKDAYKKAMLNDVIPTGTSVEEIYDKIKDKFLEMGLEVQTEFTQSIMSWIREKWRKYSSREGTEGTDTAGADTLGAPKAMVGKLSDIMSEEMDKLNLSWSVQKNVVTIRAKGGSDAVPAIILSRNTGLIGSPERDERGGIVGKALMIEGLEPGRKVTIESRVVSGDYVVAKTHEVGDTFGNDAFIKFEAFIEGAQIQL